MEGNPFYEGILPSLQAVGLARTAQVSERRTEYQEKLRRKGRRVRFYGVLNLIKAFLVIGQ